MPSYAYRVWAGVWVARVCPAAFSPIIISALLTVLATLNQELWRFLAAINNSENCGLGGVREAGAPKPTPITVNYPCAHIYFNIFQYRTRTEPAFVNLIGSPGIDSQPVGIDSS
jgi:hypothetical protein